MTNGSEDLSLLDTAETFVGRQIDKYKVVAVVGQGGMGTVYEALNTTINKRVAMKCIDSALAENEEATTRFQREALAASAIESPYIVQIFDAGSTSDGIPYIVMELLRGQDLGQLIKQQQQLSVEDALRVTIQVLKALQQAHNAGIVHRDLKPDNVFLVAHEDEPVAVKLLDFGVSKIARSDDAPLQTLTRAGTVVGTPYYMSPEQAQAFPDVDGRTDIYSTGAILYECLTGQAPHTGQSYEQVIVSICTRDTDDVRLHNPKVPESVSQVIARAMSRERDERYATAKDMLNALVESAPDALKNSLVASGSEQKALRSSGSGSTSGVTSRSGAVSGAPVTPASTPLHEGRVISGSGQSLGGGALADTVQADSGLTPLGISSGAQPAHASRWPLALVGAGLLAVAGVGIAAVLLLRPADPPAQDPQQVGTAGPTTHASTATQAATKPSVAPTTTVTTAASTTTASSSPTVATATGPAVAGTQTSTAATADTVAPPEPTTPPTSDGPQDAVDIQPD